MSGCYTGQTGCLWTGHRCNGDRAAHGAFHGSARTQVFAASSMWQVTAAPQDESQHRSCFARHEAEARGAACTGSPLWEGHRGGDPGSLAAELTFHTANCTDLWCVWPFWREVRMLGKLYKMITRTSEKCHDDADLFSHDVYVCVCVC